MVYIHNVITAQEIAAYVNELGTRTQELVGARLFPARKQLGLKLTHVKGANGQPVVLRASAFDTKATFRDRMEVELMDETMPFFKEAMLVKEADRQQLNTLAQTGNQTLINTVLGSIFNDSANLVAGARARLEAMRMQVLATGKIAIKSNGVAQDFDYGVDEANQGGVDTAWGEEGATPLQDLQDAIESLRALGGRAEVIYLNSKTYGDLRKGADTIDMIGENGVVRNSAIETFFNDEYGVRIAQINDVFIDDDGNTKKYFPDGRVTLAPNATLGNTVFGTSPEESDLVSGANLNVEVVDTGIAITTNKTVDPVNVETKVSMVALPSFENIGQVYMLDVGTDSI